MSVYYSKLFDSLPFSETGARFNLATNAVQSWTIPGTADYQYSAEFCYGNTTSNVFVGYNTSPTIPASGSMTVSGYVECRPSDKRQVRGGDVLYFVTPDATDAYVTVTLRTIS